MRAEGNLVVAEPAALAQRAFRGVIALTGLAAAIRWASMRRWFSIQVLPPSLEMSAFQENRSGRMS